MTRVWEKAAVKGSALLLLLAIADHAHDDGTGAWPSQKTLAAKTRLSVRQVRRLLKMLEAKGELRVVERDGATALLTVLAGADKMSAPTAPDVRGSPDIATSGGSDILAGTQDTAMSDKPRTVPEPSGESSGNAALLVERWVAGRKAGGRADFMDAAALAWVAAAIDRASRAGCTPADIEAAIDGKASVYADPRQLDTWAAEEREQREAHEIEQLRLEEARDRDRELDAIAKREDADPVKAAKKAALLAQMRDRGLSELLSAVPA